MRRNLLGVLQRAAVLQIDGNSGRLKSMATGGVGQGDSLGRRLIMYSMSLRVIGLVVSLSPFLKLRDNGPFLFSPILAAAATNPHA